MQYSSFSFIIPALISLYYGKIDHFILQVLAWLTSIFRWGYPANILFQYLDSIVVKLIFLTNIYYTYKSKTNENDIMIYLIWAILITIFIYYIIGCVCFSHYNNKNIIFHMLVHIYTFVGFLLTTYFYKSFVKINYSNVLKSLKSTNIQ